MLILSNVTKPVNRKTRSHLSLCRVWEMSVCVAWTNTKCQILHVPLDGLVCASLDSKQPFGTATVSPLGKGTWSLLFALSFSFSRYLNYLWFLVQPSTFLFLLILSAKRLRISPAVLTRTYGQLKQISVLQIRIRLAKTLCWDSTSCMRGTPGIFPFC